MGGHQSDKRYGARRRVEQCIALSSSWMLQNNYLDLSVGQRGFHTIIWRNYHNEPRHILTAELEHSASNEMRLYLSSTRQIVSLHSTALHFGGVRWWFHCPGLLATLPETLSRSWLCTSLSYLSRSHLRELHRGEVESGIPCGVLYSTRSE